MDNIDLKSVCGEYEDLKRTIKEAEERIKVLKPILEDNIEEGQELNTGTATFVVNKGRTSWKYSEELSNMEAELKDRQKEEVQTGVAQKVEGKSFVVCNLKE